MIKIVKTGFEKLNMIGILFLIILISFFIKNYVELNEIYYGNFELGRGFSDVRMMMGEVPSWFVYIYPIIYFCIILIFLLVLIDKKTQLKINPTRFFIYFLMVFWMWILLLIFTEEPLKYLLGFSYASERLAPGTMLAIGLYFVAYQDKIWHKIKRSFPILLVISCVFFIYGLFQLDDANRFLAFKWLKAPGGVLTLIAVICLGMNNKKYPVFVYLAILFSFLTGILTQTRLTVLMFSFNILLFFFLYSRKIELSKVWKQRISILFWFSLLMVIIFGVFSFYATFNPIILSKMAYIPGIKFLGAFIGRLLEDTRTEQAAFFFTYFIESLPFGIGYPSSDELTGLGEYGIDSGYLNTLYVTGIPMIVLFIILMVLPSFRALTLKLSKEDLAIVTVAITRAIWLFSSATTMLTFDFFIFILLSGRVAYLCDRYSKKSSHK